MKKFTGTDLFAVVAAAGVGVYAGLMYLVGKRQGKREAYTEVADGTHSLCERFTEGVSQDDSVAGGEGS